MFLFQDCCPVSPAEETLTNTTQNERRDGVKNQMTPCDDSPITPDKTEFEKITPRIKIVEDDSYGASRRYRTRKRKKRPRGREWGPKKNHRDDDPDSEVIIIRLIHFEEIVNYRSLSNVPIPSCAKLSSC